MPLRYLVFEDEFHNHFVATWTDEMYTHADYIRQHKLTKSALFGGHVLYNFEDNRWILYMNEDYRTVQENAELPKRDQLFIMHWLESHYGKNTELKESIRAISDEERNRNVRMLRAIGGRTKGDRS